MLPSPIVLRQKRDRPGPSPEAAPSIVGRLFRADGDHITDLRIPAVNSPIDVLLWHSRVFQYKGTEASGQPVYFEVFAYAVPEVA
jgi:hypothetical protein